MSEKNVKKKSAVNRFVELVTEGPENHREKFAGKNSEQIREEHKAEMNEKLRAQESRREQKSRDKDAKRAARLDEKMSRYDKADWNKPIFLRRRVK